MTHPDTSQDRDKELLMPDETKVTAAPVLSPAELAEVKERMKANEGLVIALDGGLCRVTASDPRTITPLTPGEVALVIAGLNDGPRLAAALSAALDENQRLRAQAEAVERVTSALDYSISAPGDARARPIIDASIVLEHLRSALSAEGGK